METIPTEPVLYIVVGLIILGLIVLVAPFKIRIVEHNLELFFLIIGCLAVTISGLWNIDLVIEALKAPVIISSVPIGIFQVVLIFGIIIHFFSKTIYTGISKLTTKIETGYLVFFLILIFGLISSIISVVVTACILAEVVAALPFDRTSKIRLIVISCFSVALGACLTPIGEPLSTILVSKLSGAPYYADFTFLLRNLGKYIIPGVFAISIYGAYRCGTNAIIVQQDQSIEVKESFKTVLIRPVKVFAFVAALVLLGEGFKPLIIWFFGGIPWWLLYWVNSSSALLDNATLTAIEIGPTMELSQIVAIVIGLTIAGGIFIPGNIPNIVAAARLNISMQEWARLGLPIGLTIMAIYFVILLIMISAFHTV